MHTRQAPHLTKRMLRGLAALLAVGVLAASAAAQSGKVDFNLLPIPRNLDLSDERSNFVIRSAQEWNARTNNSPDVTEPLPAIDFDRYTLLVANAGYKANGPVVVTFDSITDVGNEIRVHVSVASPTTCPQVPEAGHFAALALSPRTDKPIQFDVSNRDAGCSRH